LAGFYKEYGVALKKYVFVVFVLAACGSSPVAQENYREQYRELLENRRFDELPDLLEKWERSEPENPEVYIGYFNYHCNLGASESAAMGEMPDGSYGVYTKREYNKRNVYEGITYLDKGLSYAPNRLDMYWGKIELLFEIEDFKAAGETLAALIEISPNYNDSWVLGGGRMVDDGEAYFLDYVNRYYGILLDASSDEAATALINGATQQIKSYPENTFAYNVLAVHYIYQEDFETALGYLRAAEKVDGTDCIILLNIGRLYAELQDGDAAKEYFDKVIKIGDADEQDAARYYMEVYGL
jgi:tetratricopeptide (TPR) repeat protein